MKAVHSQEFIDLVLKSDIKGVTAIVESIAKEAYDAGFVAATATEYERYVEEERVAIEEAPYHARGTLSFAEFDKWYGAIVPQSNGENELIDTLAEASALAESDDHIWTVVNADAIGDHEYIVPRLAYVNKFAYIVTKRPHTDASGTFMWWNYDENTSEPPSRPVALSTKGRVKCRFYHNGIMHKIVVHVTEDEEWGTVTLATGTVVDWHYDEADMDFVIYGTKVNKDGTVSADTDACIVNAGLVIKEKF